jgi:hypothetical protein
MAQTGKGSTMRLFKAGLVQLLLVSALGLAPASPAIAFELPDVHVLSGETYPSSGEGKIEGVGAAILESVIGEKLTASGVTVTAELTLLSSLAGGTIKLTGVTEPKSKTSCNTVGDAAGTVKIRSEYHVVDIETSPLTAAILVLFPEITIECNSGKLKIKVRSPVLLKLEKVTAGTDVTEFGLVAKCNTKGEQELQEYFDENAKLTHADLTANFGLGFELVCFSMSKELVVKSNKMLDFLF